MGSHHGHITHVLTSRKGHEVSKVSRQVLRKLCKTPHLQGNSRRITALQNQPFPNYTLHFRSTRSRHTSSASQRTTTSHSPCTRSISQAPTHDRNEMYFFSRRLEAKQAVPQVDACFQKHPPNTNNRRITAFQNQLHARFPKHPLKTRSIGIYRHHSARQPAIPHAHARFHRHTLTIEMKCICLTKT